MATADSSSLSVTTARVALVGNPNTGKSTLFNDLAGMNVRTGNYPGVTIDKKIGKCRLSDRDIDVVDLPGTYSLAPRSPDELVAVEVLTGDVAGEPPVAAIVCVVNATLLQRNLFLVSQLLELGKPLVIALNMSDVASSRGLMIDTAKLSENLGVPVVATSALRRTGVQELKDAIGSLIDDPTAADHRRDRPLPEEFYSTCDELRESLSNIVDATDQTDPANGHLIPDDYLIERMLLDRGGESEHRAVARLGEGASAAIESARAKLTQSLGDAGEMECSARYAWAKKKLAGVISETRDDRPSVTDRLDAVLTNRIGGLLCFAAIMLLIFQCIYAWSGYPMDWIDGATGAIADGVRRIMPPGMLRSLITDGVIAGVGGVLIFLPQIALLFLFLALLEDCGYMSRAAFLVDRVMSAFGLSGKSFLPLMSSFACAVPGVMATRVIENRRDRFATIMVAPLMSCSARLPVYLLLIGAFIPATKVLGGWVSLPALVLMAMYLIGVVVAIPVAWILKKTILRGETAPFVLELPEYKIPSLKVVMMRVWEASKAFVVRAGTLIFAASILIWFAGFIPGDHSRRFELERQMESTSEQMEFISEQIELTRTQVETAESIAALNELSESMDAFETDYRVESARLLEGSLLGQVGHAIEPAVRPLGWDWKIGVGAIASFPAREVIIATLGTIYALGGDVDEEDEGLVGAIRASTWPDGRPVYTIPVALSIMVFFALCAQCVSTLLVIRRETNSWRWPILSFSYMTVLAYVGALVTYQVGTRFF